LIVNGSGNSMSPSSVSSTFTRISGGTETGNTVRLQPGQSATLRLNVQYTPASAGSYHMQLAFVGWSLSSSPSVPELTNVYNAVTSPVAVSPTMTAPVINYFTASSSQIVAGQSAILAWSATNSVNDGGCYLFAGPLATNNYSLITGSQAAFSGTLTVSPSVTTTYTLQCYSSWKDGTPRAEKSVTVSVSSPPSTVACRVVDIYTKLVPGKVYYELFMSVQGWPSGQGTVAITGTDSYASVPYSVQSVDGSGNAILKAGQTFNGTAANYLLQRKGSIVPISYGGVSISCSPIASNALTPTASANTADAQYAAAASAYQELISVLQQLKSLLTN
jgi:hypothetical protein